MYECGGHTYECQFAVILKNQASLKRQSWGGGGGDTMFLGDGGGGGERSWAFATYVFGGVKYRNKC